MFCSHNYYIIDLNCGVTRPKQSDILVYYCGTIVYKMHIHGGSHNGTLLHKHLYMSCCNTAAIIQEWLCVYGTVLSLSPCSWCAAMRKCCCVITATLCWYNYVYFVDQLTTTNLYVYQWLLYILLISCFINLGAFDKFCLFENEFRSLFSWDKSL